MILNNLTHITHKYSDLRSSSILLIFLFFFAISSLLAQKPHCHADEMLQQHLEAQGLEHEIKEYIQSLKDITPNRSAELLTIPVVVHVIHSGEPIGIGPNIIEAQIFQQLQILNNDFNQLNTDQAQIPSEFAGAAANVEIEFCLAKTDPNGLSTSGITRTEYSSTNSVNYIETTIKPQTQWDPSRYMNLWILRMPDANVLGYSYLPTANILNSARDGIVISYLKIGNLSNTTKGRTLVHEVGHYFGLPHLWGANENDCTEDDQISDTPAVRAPYYGHPVYPQFTCGTSDMFMNFMDYVDDNCMFMFTEGQKTVMHSVANNQRASLLSSNVTACNTTVSTSSSPELNDLLKIFPNPCKDDLTLSIPDDQTIKELSIFDSSGKVVEIQAFTDEISSKSQQVNTASFHNGMYIIRMETYSGEIYAKRFVKLAK